MRRFTIKTKNLTCVILTLLVCLSAWSTTYAEQDKTALVGGTLIDGLGSTPIYNSVILIEGNKIIATGTQAELDVPSGYQVVSTEGKTVMPGLWEMHAHLMLAGHSDYAHWDKKYPDRLEDEIMPAAAEQLLLAGVTTARDLGAPLKESASIKNRINSGQLHGPTPAKRDTHSPIVKPVSYTHLTLPTKA